jgi:two-component system, OmpR family, sensor histidine kinase KdpD
MTPGRLRIYLGMCPGVGKTYEMLLAAQQRHEEGRMVLIGWLETHGRVETTAVAAGLKRVPPRAVEHRGVRLEEMDLDALLAARPSLAVVDELAHTNAPGSRHPKRYQDVLELLAAGLDVFTTINIQHIESRRDAVAGITGVMVRETVPDSVIDRADEIELVDLTPEQLRQRLAEGKVYLGERAARAGEAFFREGNLKALREMALRIVADHADREVRRHMKENAIRGPWRSRERLLVAVAPSPHAERLIRLGRRLADGLDATWIAAHADTGMLMDEASRDRLSANLALARSLGAEVVSVNGSDAAEVLVDLARRENVTQIIAGKALHTRLWQRGLSDRLVQMSGEIDVLLVHPGAVSPVQRPAAPARSAAGWWRDIGLAAGLLAAGSALGLLAEPAIGYRSVTLLYLLVVAASGLFLRPGAVLALAVASAAAWNVLFTEPRMSFSMWKAEDIVLLATFVIVSGIVGHQASRLRRRERASREDETRARTLYELISAITGEGDPGLALDRGLRQAETIAEGAAALLLVDECGDLHPVAGAKLTAKELSVCHVAAESGASAGRFTGTLPESTVLALPLRAGERTLGVCAVRPQSSALASPLRRDLLDAFAAQAAVLLHRNEAERNRRRAASHDLQRALLDNVSHELRTPVTVIRSGVERLRQDPSAPVLDEVESAARRLDRVTSQLVTLSRVQSGLVAPQPEMCDARDLLGEVASEFGAEAPRIRIECRDFTFSADAGLLHTALSNLVRNALQYSPAGSEVVLRASDVDGAAIFSVDDRGPGIPEDQRGRLFERFQRGQDVTSFGMGLGLSIAKCFAEAIGGSLTCSDRDGGGTKFSIHLPTGNA